ncbi:MAG: hypothetical protein PSU93_10920 [Methylobacter sp.]|uniref:Uncharacterized protein n=1 Tax=Candidatus Methylobacter titanis TaxID=3053457 RepID=A0AA43Q4Z0_9GAMM|nr:hypothetical protein [Candidatus Methylobacter titanis]
MSSNNKLETIYVEQLSSSVLAKDGDMRAIAHAQWKCIDELASQYKDKKIRGTNNNFEDDRWTDSLNNRSFIDWKKIVDNDKGPALILLLKIGVYHQITTRGNSISTVKGTLSLLMILLNEVIKNKSVLVGRKNELLLGFDEITTNDVCKAIDRRIKSHHTIKGHTVGALNIIKEIPKHEVNYLSIYKAKFDYPWEGGSFYSWVNRRHSDLNISPKESKPYLPMPSRTTQQIIECSMNMIERYGEDILEIHNKALEFNDFNYIGLFHSKYGIEYMKGKSYIFDSLIPIVITKYKYGRERISVEWFERIVALLRGACINIMLLTTGLRNFDLISLKIGCCKKSDKVDILNYIDAFISKSSIHMSLPVPDQTRKAIELLERLRWKTSNPYVISPTKLSEANDKSEYRVYPSVVNRCLVNFAKHFDIHFVITDRNDEDYTAHCYRATVAGWLETSSNLAILLIKRLFGHTNSLMPLAYLHHNPLFIQARKESLEQASEAMSTRMAQAAEDHVLSGKRGEDLIRGFEKHKSECKVSSESLTDKELFTTFKDRIKERIVSGSMYAMMTPFGVICTRNPNDSTPTPCAKLSDRDKLRESGVDKELWDYMQALPNPGQCTGKACEHAMLGPWSTAIRDSFSWYVDFLEGRAGQELTTESLKIEAKSFVKQYAPDMQKIFGLVDSHA